MVKASVKKDCFSILRISENYDLDLTILEKNYLKICSLIHPDNFVSDLQKEVCEKKLLDIQNAYRILRDDILRAEYMMKIRGINHDNIAPSEEFLNEMFNLRMRLEEEKQDDAMIHLVKEKIRYAKLCLMRAFDMDNHSSIKEHYLSLRYLNKLI
ncbi:DnaJ domain-containing protein [Anaplasmataceae bacterium AB001_6]|nr:DnaJ domain-containing protein [Anaplasmataceae bacterium AB001_6]